MRKKKKKTDRKKISSISPSSETRTDHKTQEAGAASQAISLGGLSMSKGINILYTSTLRYWVMHKSSRL